MLDQLPIFTGIPFVLMLAAIAVMPLAAEHFWEQNKNKLIIALILGLPTAAFLIINGHSHHVEHTILFDYIPFIILLGSLFVTTGGIFIDADFKMTPKNNTLIMLAGAVLASVMGTTGAAMLLLRLLLNTNQQRQNKVHIVLFFIAIVANCGGLLTPLGDPPLFMMYLRGADFFWFLNFWPAWVLVNGLLLTIFFFMDKHYYKKEAPQNLQADVTQQQPLKIEGKINFVWLAIIIAAVAFVNPATLPFMRQSPMFGFIRDAIMLAAAMLSLATTKKTVRQKNNFSWTPIAEVAYLFLGIFLTMIPVLLLLAANSSAIGLETPTQFYFITGALSSVLDNTPTAVTFYSLAHSLFSATASGSAVAGIPEIFMQAICLGAVFFGSLTYIGNGPNFMVKAIAEQNGIKMPQFFQYIYKFSLIIILPVLIICNFVFFFLLN